MTFDEWLTALAVEFERIGWGISYVERTGAECWREMYDDGLTPVDAVSEEMSAAAY